MRSLPLILAALFCSFALSAPEEASARPGLGLRAKKKPKRSKKKKGKKKKGKKGKKGKKKGGHHDGDDDDDDHDDDDDQGDDDDDGGGGGGGTPNTDGPLPNGVSARIAGAGTRLSFTFGGKVKIYNGAPIGKFNVTLAPRPPVGDTFLVQCRYTQFDDLSITASVTTFNMRGRCMRMFDTGRTEWFDGHNRIQIVNRLAGDSIAMTIIGDGLGITIPGGQLSAGDFTVTLPE